MVMPSLPNRLLCNRKFPSRVILNENHYQLERGFVHLFKKARYRISLPVLLIMAIFISGCAGTRQWGQQRQKQKTPHHRQEHSLP